MDTRLSHSTYSLASVLQSRHRKFGQGRLVAVQLRARGHGHQELHCNAPHFGLEGAFAVGVKHPAFVHQQTLQHVTLQVRPRQPPKQSFTPQHHIEGMVSMVTISPERK